MQNYHVLKSIIPGDDPAAFVVIPAPTFSRETMHRYLLEIIEGGRIAVDQIPVLRRFGVDLSGFDIGRVWEPVDRLESGPVRRLATARIPDNHSHVINFEPTLG